MNTKNQKNQKGFTMIELIIVVAIMAIIGAVLVPMFSTMSTKARLTTDITTVKTLQRQLDVYKAEVGQYPDVFATLGDVNVPSTVISALIADNYLDAKDLTTGPMIKLQTGGTLMATGGRCYLKVTTGSDYVAVVNKINANPQDGNKDWAK